MQGTGLVIGKRAPDFTLRDHTGQPFVLSQAYQMSPVMLAFYPHDFSPVCTRQLCNYKDHIADFQKYDVQIFGISGNTIEKHRDFSKKYDFPFRLLSDPGNLVAKSYGCTSRLMLGNVTRAIFIVNKPGVLLYRYIEPLTLTRRKAEELVGILADMKSNALI
jgi:peroxiredoxin Q/BCP